MKTHKMFTPLLSFFHSRKLDQLSLSLTLSLFLSLSQILLLFLFREQLYLSSIAPSTDGSPRPFFSAFFQTSHHVRTQYYKLAGAIVAASIPVVVTYQELEYGVYRYTFDLPIDRVLGRGSIADLALVLQHRARPLLAVQSVILQSMKEGHKMTDSWHGERPSRSW